MCPQLLDCYELEFNNSKMSITSARTILTQTGRHATQSDKMKESGKERGV